MALLAEIETMKEIALSICALAGAYMAVGGAYVESMESTRRVVRMDGIGMWITILAFVLVAFLALRSASGKK